MASRNVSRPVASRLHMISIRTTHPQTLCLRSRAQVSTRHFSASPRSHQQQHRKEGFRSRLSAALNRTRVQWYAIPVGIGVGFLGGVQAYKVTAREKAKREEQEDAEQIEEPGKPKKRPRVRPSGPWTVQIMSTLPLKALSRWWGWFNELTIPYYLRVPGFKLYSWVFGVK